MKSFVLSVMAIAVIALTGCGKDDAKKTITNLSGQTWYDTNVFFSTGPTAGDKFNGVEQKGTVEIGESIVVSTNEEYFTVSFENALGKLNTSKILPFGGSAATVKARDIY